MNRVLCLLGTLIPYHISSRSTEMRTTAQVVLIVEKDATFQKLLSEKVLDELQDMLLVTVPIFILT